jgi:hypothetical protein
VERHKGLQAVNFNDRQVTSGTEAWHENGREGKSKFAKPFQDGHAIDEILA